MLYVSVDDCGLVQDAPVRGNLPGLGPAAEVLLAVAQKYPKGCAPAARLFPAVLTTGGTRTDRPMAR
ncbi:MAG: hypothetical protein KA260_01340 [Burkholderiales bacterium]|nr:hypothetical protein [Burkholderiales bacterium]